MNNSGKTILSLSSFFKMQLNNILVIHDELDLPNGIIETKYGKGHNGHNGLRSIIENFKKKNKKRIRFFRIRIGIGRPKKYQSISNFVLSIPKEKELLVIEHSISNYIKILSTKLIQNNKEIG